MAARYAYLLSIGKKDHNGHLLSTTKMTLVFNEHGLAINSRAEAAALASALSSDGTVLALDELFLLPSWDGSVFCFPDRTRQMINPYSYPLEIAYGFILPWLEAAQRIPEELACPSSS